MWIRIYTGATLVRPVDKQTQARLDKYCRGGFQVHEPSANSRRAALTLDSRGCIVIEDRELAKSVREGDVLTVE